MQRLEYKPACLALFINPQAIRFLEALEPSVIQELTEEFLTSVHSLFPDLPLITNYSRIHRSPSVTGDTQIPTEYEWDFLYSLIDILPPSQSPLAEWDEVCFLYFRGLAPLLDTELTGKIWERHRKYLSQYSYSENLPEGIVPRILTREFLASLPPKTLTFDSHEFFLKNINQYDVEIFFQKPDLRQWRLSLLPNDPRSFSLVQSLRGRLQGTPFRYENLHPWLLENTQWVRTAPSYIEWEIYRGCEMKCSFCLRNSPTWNSENTAFPAKSVARLVAGLEEFQSPYTVCLGGMGEPFLHPDWKEIFSLVLAGEHLQELIVETSLALPTSQIAELQNFIRVLPESLQSRLNFIINITTNKDKRYQDLYGQPSLPTIRENLDSLCTVLPQKNLAVQILKIKEVEDEIDSYFDHYEKAGFPIVFQKYNRYAGLMEEKRVSDLTPLNRDFCWHLGRDLYINADGIVSICKQMPSHLKASQEQNYGNVFQDSLQDIWNRGMNDFAHSCQGAHERIPAPCTKCDEWYTFNA